MSFQKRRWLVRQGTHNLSNGPSHHGHPTVRIKLLSRDQYARAVCSVSYPGLFWPLRKDLSEELLKEGLAVMYRLKGAQYDGKFAYLERCVCCLLSEEEDLVDSLWMTFLTAVPPPTIFTTAAWRRKHGRSGRASGAGAKTRSSPRSTRRGS